MKFRKLSGLCLLLFIVFNNSSFAQQKASFLLIDEQLLTKSRGLLKQGDKEASAKINAIINRVDSALTKEPYSVTFNKTKTAPSNDKHDYISQAPYWWADPAKPKGLPYIRKDGERNPEIYLLHDRSQLGDMCTAVKQLGLAYYYTGNEKYAVKAKSLLQTWFVDSATRMNPNLNYAQYIPGLNDGRGIGIIESRELTAIPDAIAMLNGSKAIDEKLINDIKDWFKAFSGWLQTSPNGNDERSQLNNHGSYYDVQLIDYSLFTGNSKTAVELLQSTTIPRIDKQFTPEGAQPLELARTKSWDYVNMNLYAWCQLAILANHLNIDLWHKQTADGRGMKAAVKWLIPYASGEKKWENQQIASFEYEQLKFIMDKASAQYPDLNFDAVFKKFPKGVEVE
ncbi:alginate lyase family protein [Mucilaginibacter rubeus]|uniref:Alginate lyase family protein n=1 Tax=Mucilaginibacter rubeus TaxID=2027860 RepID=A0A5C1I5I7_9SPHI|nr:alginate lyase family protein [Mucilaginibacter rubeus]QEM12678.1 alginate lyase family protein [Mucilaginibacter rubeus]